MANIRFSRLKSLFASAQSATSRRGRSQRRSARRGETTLPGNATLISRAESLEDRTLLSATHVLQANLQHTLTGPPVTAEAGALFGYKVSGNSAITVIGAEHATVNGVPFAGAAYVYDNATGNLLWTLHDPTPDASVVTADGFGFDTAVSDQWIVVSNNHSNPSLNKPGEVHIFSATTGAFVRTIANPEASPGDRFGESLAISGSTLAVGVPGGDVGALNTGTVYTFNISSGELLRTIANPSQVSGDNFGREIAMSGNNLVIGALFEDTGAVSAGSAYVFNSTTGALLRTYRNPTPQLNEQFGSSVAIQGDTVAIAAYKDNSAGTDSGSVYVFSISSGSVVPLRSIPNPVPTIGDQFGYGISISGNKIAIGTPSDDVGTTNTGTVYVYDLTTNAAPQIIANPAPAANDFFGLWPRFVGTDLLVPAPYDDASGVDAGTVYRFAAGATTPNRTYSAPVTVPEAGSNFGQEVVGSLNHFAVASLDHSVDGVAAAGLVSVYERSSGRKLHDLREPVSRTNRFFGGSMAAEGDILVVVAEETSAASGTVYVYQMSTGQLLRTLVSPDGVADHFGSSVSISGNRLVVGARLSGGVGKVWVFDVTSGERLQTILNPDPTSGDWFGAKVGIFGTQLVVSAPFDDFGALNSGSFYVFNAATGGLPTATVGNPSPSASENFPNDLAIHSGRIVASSMLDDTTATDGGIAYIFNATTGGLLNTLTNPVGGASDWFGYGAGISEQFVAISVHSADRGATNAGSVAIFDAETGQFQFLVDNPFPSPSGFFGNTALAFSGSSLIVGATGADRPSTDSGAAYIYQLQDSRLSLVKDILPGGTAHSSPSRFFAMGDVLFFSAFTSTTGSELWRSDGTDAGTYMVRDIRVGTGSSSPTNLAMLNGTLVFSTTNADGTKSLWKSDGTESGTVLIKAFASPVTARGIGSLVQASGVLYFYVDDGVNGDELWKTDGTTAGTVLVKNIRSGNVDSDPDGLVNVAGTLYFTAADDAGDRELWKSDGTSAGTVRVKDIATLSSSGPLGLTNGNGVLYFIAQDGTNGQELWKSDGTSAGTVMVRNIRTGVSSSSPSNLTMVGSTLFFAATDDAGDQELWKSDGTSAGTVRVKDIYAGSTSSSATNFVNMNGRLYFVAGESASGRELWRSDGTTAGTSLVRDINVGTTNSTIVGLVNLNGMLYFRATDTAANGAELWRSDGTSAGTMMVTDVTPASGSSSNPQFMTALGNKIFAQAVSASFATELWAIDAVSTPTVSSFTTSVASGGSKSVTLAAVDRADAPFSYSITQSPANGTLSGTAPNLTYTPNSGFVGTDEFFYTASNSFGSSSEGRIEIGVFGTPSTVSFASTSTNINEAAGAASILVTLTPAVPYDTTVRVTLSGTATAGQDFRSISEVVIPAGQSSAPLSLGIIDDTHFEGSTAETVVLTMQSNQTVVLGSRPSHAVLITDNDPLPRVSFERPSMQLAEGSGTNLIRIVLDRASTQNVIVPLTIQSTATIGNGNDFSIGTTTVTIPAGSRSAVFSLTVFDDTLPEVGEYIVISADTIGNGVLSSGNTGAQFIKIDIPPNDSPIVNMVTSGVYVDEGVGTVTVTATLSEAPASSVSIPFSLAGQMTQGALGDYTVSANAFSFAAGSKSASVTVIINNDTLAEQPESVVLVINNPQTTGYLLGPIGASAITVTDNDTPKVSFSSAANSYWENDGNVTISATLSVAQPTQVTVPVSVSSALAGDYATNGTDFELLQPSFVFAPNSTTATVTLRVINNPANELTERVVLRLDAPFETAATSPNGVFLGSAPTTEIRILDDDPFVSVSSARYNETNGDGFFTFTLSAPSNRGVTIPFSLGGDAKAGSDYTRPSPITVTIPAGQTSVRLPVRLIDDSIDERDEQITLTMGTPNNSIAAGTTASLTIIDNDAEPTASLSITKSSFEKAFNFGPRVSESTGTARTVEVVLSRPTFRDVAVDLAIAGSALLGTDYTINSSVSSRGRIIIPAGSSSAIFTITAINDRVYEGTENIKIKVRNVSNAANEKSPRELTINVIDSSSKPKPLSVNSGNDSDRIASQLSGTQLLLPQGALDGSTISITLGPSLSNAELSALGIGSGFAGTTGPAVVVSSNNADYSSPMTLRLPIDLNGGPLSETTLFFDANFNGVQDFLDLNGNGTQDEDEPNETSVLSQADGSSAFEFDPAFDLDGSGFLEASEGRLVAANGIDTATGLPWEARMTAPMGIYSLTPLTTLVESVQRTQFLTVPDAIDRVVTAFGVDGYDLRFGNPLYDMLSGDALAAKAYAAHIQLFTTVLEITQLFNGLFNNTLNVGTISETVFEQMAASIAVEGSILDLSNTTVIRGIIDGVGNRLGFAASDAIVNGTNGENGAAGIIAQHMQIMRSYDATNTTAFPTRRDFAEQIIKAKVVMQGASATRLRDVGTGAINISVAYSEFTGSALQARIAAAHAGVVVPAAVGVTDSQIVEGDSGQQFMEFTVVIVGEHEGNVSVSYSTFDGTATAESGDYAATTGTLTWAAGDMTSRTIQVPINGDNVAELDEFLTLALTEATNASIRRQEGTGYIQNNDDLTLNTSVIAPTGDSNVVMIMDGQDGGLYQNGTPILQGLIVSPLHSTILGANDRNDTFELNFGVERYRSDNFTVVGGGGSGSDQFVTNGGTFSEIRHTLLSGSAGHSKFVPLAASDVPVNVDWSLLEGLDYSVASTDLFVIRVPSTISSLIIEDADSGTEGQMRVRSATGEFTPFVFTNPGTGIHVLRDSESTTVTVESTDPAFTGTVTISVSATLTNIVTALPEDANTSTRTLMAEVETDPLLQGQAISVAGTDAGMFEVDGTSVYLKAGSTLDYETKPLLTVEVRVTDPNGAVAVLQFSLSISDVVDDNAAPTSLITALPAASNSVSLNIAVTGQDPGAGASGVLEYDLYYSTGGSFVKFATVPAGSPSTTFNGTANTTYWFRSLARDNAGNVETKISADTYTRIGDVVPPITQVTTAVPTSSGLFTVQMTGNKPSGTPITAFDVYVVIDSGEPILVGAASSVATGGGNYSGEILFQGILDGVSRTYRFFSRGRDGSGNVEAAPVSGDVSSTYSFASAGLTATAIDVQNGVNQRSYVRYLDVLFSTSTGLDALLATGRVKVERFAIDAGSVNPGDGAPVTGFGLVQNGNKLRLDFGSNGLGGLRQAGNGFYRILLDVDGNGSFADAGDNAFEFHRLFGDANGDAKVDVADTTLVTSQIGRVGANLDGDLDGNGSVNSTDRLFTTQQRGKLLLEPLVSWLDD
jgi:ELWxxDGT repeat protein